MNLLENGSSNNNAYEDVDATKNKNMKKPEQKEKKEKRNVSLFLFDKMFWQNVWAGILNNKGMAIILSVFVIIIIILLIIIGSLVKKNSEMTQSDITNEQQAEIEKIEPLEPETVENEETKDSLKEDTISDSIVVDEVDESKIPTQENANSDNNADLALDLPEEDYSYEKEYILNEMLPYWEAGHTDAVYDLVKLRRYRKLSYSLHGTTKFYYKGAVNGNNEPIGKGLAIYADNTYYYGDFVDGKREGEGIWFHFYLDDTSPYCEKGMYTSHSYAGSWKNDLPNGIGTEHYDVDTTKMGDHYYAYQTIVGNVVDAKYNGEMYCTTIDAVNNVEEWNATCHMGTFDLVDTLTEKKECPVWREVHDEESPLKIWEKDNKNQGIAEFVR